MASVPAHSYKLYRVTLNSMGDGVSVTGHQVYYSLDDAKSAVITMWLRDNCRKNVEWKAVNQLNGKTVASKRQS